MEIKFEILGKPQGLDRSKQTAQGFRFDSAKNRSNKALIRMIAENEAEKMNVSLPIPAGKTGYQICLDIEIAPTKSWTKKKLKEIELGLWRPLSKPDIDNVLKLYLDALNGVVIEDDRFVTSVSLTRKFSKRNRVICSLSWQEESMQNG